MRIITILFVALAKSTTATHHRSRNAQEEYKNPFYKSGGCLNGVSIQNKTRHKVRICNSQDLPEAVERGFCQPSPYIDYKEVRFAAQTWTTNVISAWILQIVLSELLDVPTSIEMGAPGTETNFYHRDATPMEGVSFDYFYSELKTASEIKDCTLLNQHDTENYQSCYHVVPEIWWDDRFPGRTTPLPGAEPPRELGALGYQALFATKKTIQNDPSLVSYVGLGGEENRAKLAATFKRPTTWKQYCEEVSQNGCATPDGIAKRAPATEIEEQAYFELDYIGHFRYTEKNNCFANPTTCTGFFADFVCGWASWANQQIYHHHIALESDNPLDPAGGFTTDQFLQIYLAAQATNSSLLFYWYDLSPLFYTFMGTDVEPTRIVLPEATQTCIDNRVDASKRCGKLDGSATLEELVGDASGSCASTTQSLKKVVSKALKEIAMNPDTPKSLWSPAYDVVQNFKISTPQLGYILQSWVERRRDHLDAGVVLRDVTCEWVIDNLEILQDYIPASHPRVIHEEDVAGNEMFNAAFGVACFAVTLVALCALATFVKRNTKQMYFAQPPFLNLLLLGLGLVAIGAICEVLPPTDVNCVAIAWVVNMGYALHLVPLLIRINAINNLATSGKQMQRVRLGVVSLYLVTFAALVAVGLYLMAWMLLDRPSEEFQYEVTGRITDDGETIITSFDYCGSSNKWYIISYAWRALVILPAGMIALVSLRIREDMNDTRQMSLLLFVHAIILAVGIIMSWLVEARSDLMAYESLLWSLDIIMSLLVFFVPKFLHSGEVMDEEPLPDVFVNTTIAVTDVIGFTAWSSVREPFQVFKILEELHGCMDTIADKRGIFKVQTVGETYVAASGLPHPSNDHAVKMAKFARDVLKQINCLTKELEIKFGPDTGDLQVRIGLHSGSVTGGFVKGKGSRFQLFGDTMTTATLMQQTGLSDHIHLSETTADALVKAGKQNWIYRREEKLNTEEKGEIQTYWLIPKTIEGEQHSHLWINDHSSGRLAALGDSKERWITWNAQTFTGLLKDIVARREKALLWNGDESGPTQFRIRTDMPAEEVVEIIELPRFDKRAAKRQVEKIDEVELPPQVVEQLTEYITEVANLYNDNPFHNFAHASYVVMAVIKYMNRIKQANEIKVGDDDDRKRTSAMEAIYKHTFGVASDPLTLFSVVFSALIHDVKHPGVPNPQLIKEDTGLAAKYKNRSVAEQRSLDLSWDLLMERRFDLLRSTICRDEQELKRFRQLLVNAVMATDLGDKELKELRNSRWDKAFAQGAESGDECSDTASVFSSSVISSSTTTKTAEPPSASQDARNRKATIVIEHLIQAADVAHMSQHWSIYRKWNERLFRECYKAYREGRAENNPADNWYEGDLGFFDFYIIPLSKKLRDCGVFGPTSDENLNYATNNRRQWEREGAAITSKMLKEVEQEYDMLPETREHAGPLPTHVEEDGSEDEA